MNTQLYRQALDSIDNEADVYAVHRGEIVAGLVQSFQTDPPIFTLRIPAGTITTQQIFFTRPEKAIPERGRLVKHKATGTYIRSSGNVDPDGKLVDDQGRTWEDEAWVEGLERRKAEAEARRKAQEDAESSLHLGTNDTKRLTIESDGNVGISTTSPRDLFHIKPETR